MNKRFLFLISILILSGFLKAQVIPVLEEPLNNSVNQKAKNLALKWKAIPGVNVYRIQYSLDSLFLNPINDLTISGTSLVISSLSNDVVYYWRVASSINDTMWSKVWHFTTIKIPEAPVLIRPANNIKNMPDSILFIWQPDELNNNYLLQISSSPDFTLPDYTFTVSENFKSVYNLSFAKNYYWRVKTLNIDFDSGPWSEIQMLRTRLADPVIISLPDSSRNVDTVQVLRWSKIESSEQYHLQVSLSENFDQQNLYKDIFITANSFTIDSLEFTRDYFWRVIALNSGGDSSSWSDTTYFRTKIPDPVLLSPANKSINNDTIINLKWKTGFSSVQFHLQVAEDINFTTIILDTVLQNTSLILDSLKYYKNYYWRAISFNDIEDSSKWSGIMNFKTRLMQSVNLFPIDSVDNIPVTVELQWSSSEGASLYKVQAGLDSLFYYPDVDTILNRNTFRLTRLFNDTVYYWRVLGLNSVKDSSLWSKSFRFRTKPGIILSSDSLKKVLYLTLSLSDTLGYISIENAGVNTFTMDSVFVAPDSLFTLQNTTLTIKPESEEKYYILINTKKIKPGSNTGKFQYRRINIKGEKDTTIIPFLFVLNKASATFSSDTLIFNRTAPMDSSGKFLSIRNIDANTSLNILSMKISGEDSASFRIVNPAKSVRARDSIMLEVRFKPAKKNINRSYLVMETNSYPVRKFSLLLQGDGRGGELTEDSYATFTAASSDSFETFTANSKKLFFDNNGNEPLNVRITFRKNYFKTENDFLNSFKLQSGDTISVVINYLTPNFRRSNLDTMVIIHNGFGKDTIYLPLKGKFDSTLSAEKFKANIRVNSESYNTAARILEKKSSLVYTLNRSLLSVLPGTEFRIKYYTGGGSVYNISSNDGTYNYLITSDKVNELGLLLWGELIKRNTSGKIIDSITVIPETDYQVILNSFKTEDIDLPRSVQGENTTAAKTKWVMFGFPFNGVTADTVFKFFGGISRMKDGEWIVYKYNPEVSDSFSLFDNFYFEPGDVYFAAQSLLDTFKINYEYSNNVLTRKLSNDRIKLNGKGWKTISSPYLYDVQVDTSIMLYNYNVNRRAYTLTNILEPGKGYFVDPSVNELPVKTYGRYNPAIYPDIISEIGWSVAAVIKKDDMEDEFYFSLINPDDIKKAGKVTQQSIPPLFTQGVESYIYKDGEKLKYDVEKNVEGAVWTLIVKSRNDISLSILKKIIGQLPVKITVEFFDTKNGSVISSGSGLNLSEGEDRRIKIIIGSVEYVKSMIKQYMDIPEKYSLSQNFPNPFNPSTKIRYSIPGYLKEKVNVKLIIYDMLGKEVTKIINEGKNSGNYEVEFNAGQLASGIYIYRLLITGDGAGFSESHKMILLK